MHELSVAISIVDLAAEQARLAGAKSVRAIELDIGALSGVDINALKFALDIAFKDTLLEESEVKINHIDVACECMDCCLAFSAGTFVTGCPECRGMNINIKRGKEMHLSSLLIEE